MKYKDYYQALGIERTASTADIKKAYRKLAHQYHPDVSKDPKGEEKFKEVAEAYAILKDKEKRREYDELGNHSNTEDFTPPQGWQQQYGSEGSSFDDVDIADLLNAFRGGHPGRGRQSSRANFASPGEDFSVGISVPLEKIYHGGEAEVSVSMPEFDKNGLPHRVPHTFRITIPKGATEGQRLRLAGKGGPGHNGGKPGDLYVVLSILPHPLFKLIDRDLYIDLPLTPWEAVLGSKITIPTLGSEITINIKPGSATGQKLRLAGQGLPTADGGAGHLYAVLQIVVPKTVSAEEQALYEQLSKLSDFNPREFMNKAI